MANPLLMATGKTRIEWVASLNTEYKPPHPHRRTSIICTIGMFRTSLVVEGRWKVQNGQFG